MVYENYNQEEAIIFLCEIACAVCDSDIARHAETNAGKPIPY